MSKPNDKIRQIQRGEFIRLDRDGVFASEEAAVLAGQVNEGSLRSAWMARHIDTWDSHLGYAKALTVEDIRKLLTPEERERSVARLPARFEFPELVGGGAKWVLRAPGGREVIAESPREYDSVEEAHAAAFMIVEAFADIANSALYDLIPNDKE